MAESSEHRDVTRRSAVAARLAAFEARIPWPGPQVTIRERRPGAVAAVHGVSAEGLSAALAAAEGEPEWGPAPGPGQAAECGPLTAMWTGPDQWLLVDATATPDALVERLAAVESAGGAVFDVSHARVCLRLRGPAAEPLLATGCPLDLEAMPVGGCGASVLGPFTVVVRRLGQESFDLWVARSYALACVEWLEHEGEAFGIAPEW